MSASSLLTSWISYLRGWGNHDRLNLIDSDFELRVRRYELLDDLYAGTAFNDVNRWGPYRQHYRLYRHVRQIWSHVNALVEFYAIHLWPGSLADDGLNLPEGERNAVPLGEDIPTELAAAIGQLWNWCNFQSVKTKIPRWTAIYGEMLVELRDDVRRGKIVMDLVKPHFVKHVQLDESGNVKFYAIEYESRDKLGTYTYRREVDKESFRTFRNDQPFDFRAYAAFDVADYDDGEAPHPLDVGRDGRGAVTTNPYGFVPARWFRHFETDGVRGEPALWGTQGGLDEINSLFAHMLDKTHVGLQSPVVVAGNLAPGALKTALLQMSGAVKRAFTEDLPDQGARDRESINVLQAPAGTRIETVDVALGDADILLTRVITALERTCPEVTMYEKLRNFSQITGPGALTLIGDVDRKVKDVAGGYDQNLKRLLQMGVAMAGWRLQDGNREGEWIVESKARAVFSPFDLTSFESGRLNFSIKSRELIQLSPRERLELLEMKKRIMPWLPPEQIGIEAGYRADQIKTWIATWEAEQAAMREQFEIPDDGDNPTSQPRRPVGAPGFGPQGRRPGQRNQGSRTRGDDANVTQIRQER